MIESFQDQYKPKIVYYETIKCETKLIETKLINETFTFQLGGERHMVVVELVTVGLWKLNS